MKQNELTLLIIDSAESYNYHLHQIIEHLVKYCEKKKKGNEEFHHPIVVFNKIDLVDPISTILPLLREVRDEGKVIIIISISKIKKFIQISKGIS